MELTNLKYNPIKVIQQYDPTYTTQLRNAFARQMRLRFEELIKVVKISIVKNDCFGLNIPTLNQMTPIDKNAFAFQRSEEKVAAFMEWIEEQINKGILSTISMNQVGTSIVQAWTNLYIADSYKRGILRARQELINAGFDIPTISESGGIDVVMNTPFHIERAGLLYTRTYSDLKGVTAEMNTMISRILTQGMIDGDGPALLARKIVAIINGDGVDKLGMKDSLGRFIPAERRAELIARTEIIRAHHLGTIQEYRNWGLEGVNVMAEVVTAGDKRVCSKCEAMAKGGPYTLEEVEGLIPKHPLCRCVAIPYLSNNKTK